MTRVSFMLLCCLQLVDAGCDRERIAKATEDPSSVQPADLLAQVLGPEPDLKMVRGQLNRLRDSAAKEELPLLEDIDSLLKRAERLTIDGTDPGKLVEITRALVGIARKLAMLRPDDFESQIRFTSSLFMISYSLENLGVDGDAYRKEALSMGNKLIEKFPMRGRSYGALAHMRSLTGKDELECLKLYKRCVELDSNAAYCREGFQNMAENYQRPRCTGDGLVPDLAFFEARTQTTRGFDRKLEHEEKAYYLAPKPLITGKDIESVVSEKDNILRITLGTKASRRFSKMTEQLAGRPGQDGYLAILTGEKALCFPRVMAKIPNGQILLNEVELESICDKVTRRNLPEL